jgi:CMP/dCMP kinase
MKKIIMTIDGYSSCGKSTLARELATELGYLFIDSGAMYRAITLYFLRNHVDWTDQKEVVKAMENINLAFVFNDDTGRCDMFLNNENVEYLIRDMVIAEKVSEVSALKEVREFAVAEQRKIGKDKGIVMDGRDIGTTVFPHAELKIFMTADPAVRVERRYAEIFAKNPNITLEEIKENLEKRDYIDTHREFSPLIRAKDAIVLDNSHITMTDQLKMAMEWVKERIQCHAG